MHTIKVTKEELEILAALVYAANNGRAVSFHGMPIEVTQELLEDANDWILIAQGRCPSCARENQSLAEHPVLEDGSCGLTQENAAEHGCF